MVKFIFMNKYIFKLLVILALFYKNIFFYNSLCCNSCKGTILDMEKNSKEIKTKGEKPKEEIIKTKKGKTKGEKTKEEIKTDEEIKKIKEKKKEEIKKPKEETKTENEKTKVEGEELEEVNIYVLDVETGKKYLWDFPQHIKGSDLKKQVAKKNYEGKNINIRFLDGTLCEGDKTFKLGQGETLRVYIVNEKK